LGIGQDTQAKNAHNDIAISFMRLKDTIKNISLEFLKYFFSFFGLKE